MSGVEKRKSERVRKQPDRLGATSEQEESVDWVIDVEREE